MQKNLWGEKKKKRKAVIHHRYKHAARGILQTGPLKHKKLLRWSLIWFIMLSLFIFLDSSQEKDKELS